MNKGIYPRGDKWMATVGVGADRTRKTFATEQEALDWKAAQEATRGATKALPVASVITPKGWTIGAARDHTYLHRWKGKKGEKTTMINADQAVAFFGPDTPCSAIIPSEVMRYMAHCMTVLNNSKATLNKKMSALRVMLDYAVDMGGLDDLPRMKRYAEAKTPPRWLTDDDERNLLAQCDALGYHTLRDFVVIGFFTGYRRQEILGLSMEDYQGGLLLLHEGDTKSGAPRAVPCSPAVKAILDQRASVGASMVFKGYSKARLWKEWQVVREALGRLGDPAFTPHKMRHACATRMVTAGVHMTAVQAWMGHSNVTTTMRYAHLDNRVLADAAQVMMNRQPVYKDPEVAQSASPASVA